MSDDDSYQPSETAIEIAKLKAAAMKAIAERGRLPQPLFWSLFNSKVQELKKGKAARRLLNELLAGLE